MEFKEFHEAQWQTATLEEQVNEWLKVAGDIDIVRTEQQDCYWESVYAGRWYRIYYKPL